MAGTVEGTGTVSVVIPVKNGIKTLQRCLDGILSQTVDVQEIVVVDSGSVDGTIDLLKRYPRVKLVEIAPGDFNHGETRNLGVHAASGDFVVLTVQDAWPVDEHWLETLLKGFKEEDVVAVCGQQVVPHHRDMNPAQWFRPYSTPQVHTYQFTEDEFKAMTPAQKKKTCSWDNVNAVYKRSVLRDMPFERTIFAEDAIWAHNALASGYTIAYNYAARVYHYHHENKEFAYRRSFAEMFSAYKIFGLKPVPRTRDFRYYLSLGKRLVAASGISVGEKIKWWGYNLTIVKAYDRALADFMAALSKDEDEVEQLYQKLCGKMSASETSRAEKKYYHNN